MSSLIGSAVASAVHLLSLAGGVTALLLRERALAGPLDNAGIRRVLAVDNASGVIALVWMGSGFWRLLGGLEKGTDYYLHNHLFWGKMGLLAIGWCFEMGPMLTFIRWRSQLARGESIDTSGVDRLRKHHWPELACILLMVPLASFMARGVGTPAATSAHGAGDAETIYMSRCAPCHQADGRGFDGKVAADFTGDKTRLRKDDATLIRLIQQGVPATAMRAFGNELSEAECAAVLGFIRRRFGDETVPPTGSASASASASATPP